MEMDIRNLNIGDPLFLRRSSWYISHMLLPKICIIIIILYRQQRVLAGFFASVCKVTRFYNDKCWTRQ